MGKGGRVLGAVVGSIDPFALIKQLRQAESSCVSVAVQDWDRVTESSVGNRSSGEYFHANGYSRGAKNS